LIDLLSPLLTALLCSDRLCKFVPRTLKLITGLGKSHRRAGIRKDPGDDCLQHIVHQGIEFQIPAIDDADLHEGSTHAQIQAQALEDEDEDPVCSPSLGVSIAD